MYINYGNPFAMANMLEHVHSYSVSQHATWDVKGNVTDHSWYVSKMLWRVGNSGAYVCLPFLYEILVYLITYIMSNDTSLFSYYNDYYNLNYNR